MALDFAKLRDENAAIKQKVANVVGSSQPHPSQSTPEKSAADVVRSVQVTPLPDRKKGVVEAPWLGGRMPDSGSREPGFESSTYDGDTLWRQQNKILVIVLGNKL